MVGVCFCYTDQAWAMNQWDYCLTSFPVDKIWVIYRGDLPEDQLRITRYRPKSASDPDDMGVCKRATLIKTAEELPKDIPLVVVAPAAGRFIQGKENLHSFQHPGNVIYLFGADNVNLCEAELGKREPDRSVFIETSSHELYVHVAAALVLYDRKRKSHSAKLRKERLAASG